MIINCCKCNIHLTQNDVIKTDEFKIFGSEIKNYCSKCFLENVKSGFGNPEKCSTCGSSLTIRFDDEETISQAKEDYTVDFICEKLLKTPEQFDEDEHDSLILYTIQPDPEEPEYG